MDPACRWISDVSSDPGARSSTTLQSPQRHHRSNAGNAVALGADNCRALAALACTILQLLHLDANTAVTQQLQNSFTRQVLSCLKPEQTICRQVIYIIALVVMMLWGKACSCEHALACFGHVVREFGSIRLDKQDM